MIPINHKVDRQYCHDTVASVALALHVLQRGAVMIMVAGYTLPSSTVSVVNNAQCWPLEWEDHCLRFGESSR